MRSNLKIIHYCLYDKQLREAITLLLLIVTNLQK